VSGPDIVRITETVSVTEREPDVVIAGYTQVTSSGSHTHTPASLGALAVASNLADVADAATARSNLGAASATHSHPGITLAEALVTSGDITLPNTSGAWEVLNQTTGDPLQISIQAAEGDYIDVSVRGMRGHNTSGYLDLAVVVSGSIVRYLSSGTGTPLLEGDPALYPAAAFHTIPGPRGFVVGLGDLDGGMVTVAVAVRGAGSGVLYASASYPWYWRLMNYRAL